jgi:TM2 domain-containing membrane protein YozV
MTTEIRWSRIRFGAAALVAAGVLFVLYPAIRPFSDEISMQGARAFASTAWVAAHVLAMGGFIALTLGLLGLHQLLWGTPVEGRSFRALVLGWAGAGLTLTFYGAEAYGLHVIGREALREHSPSVLALASEVRHGPGLVVFVGGLVLLAGGVIVMATAVWRSRILPRWTGVPVAVGFAFYLPQFAATQPVRIAHGLLIAVGCLWLGVTMWRRAEQGSTRERPSDLRATAQRPAAA